jgi:tRNA threonylcarbamoyladenosine biosynthesis protein TsaE
MKAYTVSTLIELEAVAQAFIETHDSGVFEVIGEMGAGKTTFISEVVRQLGEESPSSPTYSLVNEYELASGEVVYHFDLYRVRSEQELVEFGFEDYLFSEAKFVFIEWPEKAASFLDKTKQLRIREAAGMRMIEF